MRKQLNTSRNQGGAVLLISLIMLLVTTFIGFSSMETSNLEAKMASSREMKEMTFQSAEAAIELAIEDEILISDAFVAEVNGTSNWPKKSYALKDTKMASAIEARFISQGHLPGDTVVSGKGGFTGYYYEIESSASRTDSNVDSVHTQGIFMRQASL